jgi:DNA-binding XRE family transcriptional regulator
MFRNLLNLLMIDFSEFPLSPNASRAARNFLGLSQTQAATKCNLPAHKIKRFETGSYVPDTPFVQALREFFEAEGYNFNDEKTPGAKARAIGDVFQAGVLGELGGFTEETDGFPAVEPGKLPRPQKANLQFMRISPVLEDDQIDRIFSCIEDNEASIVDIGLKPVTTGFLSDTPSMSSQAAAVVMLRRLAENGLLFAQLMGRELLPTVVEESLAEPKPSGFFLGDLHEAKSSSAKTVGELVRLGMLDMQLAVLDADKDALARRKSRPEPTEVLQALVG